MITSAAGGSGALEEVDAIFTVTTGGTIGTTGIKATISLDGGTTEQAINLGTATSDSSGNFAMPDGLTHSNIVIGLAGAVIRVSDLDRTQQALQKSKFPTVVGNGVLRVKLGDLSA